jgi:hypothetical protein
MRLASRGNGWKSSAHACAGSPANPCKSCGLWIRTRITGSGGCASWHSCRQTARMYWLLVSDKADEAFPGRCAFSRARERGLHWCRAGGRASARARHRRPNRLAGGTCTPSWCTCAVRCGTARPTRPPNGHASAAAAAAMAGGLRGGGSLLDVCRVCDAAASTLTACLAS